MNATTSSSSHSELTQREKIQILLTEYLALRAEVDGRNKFGFQIGAVCAVAITWVLQQLANVDGWSAWVGLAILTGGVTIFSITNMRDLARLGRRLKEIEHEVNSRVGEHLLVWETLWGGTRQGPIAYLFTSNREWPRSRLPPLNQSYLQGGAELTATESHSDLPPGPAAISSGAATR